MTRLRYKKEDVWLYTMPFLCGLAFVQISIDPINLKYYINKISNDEELKTGTANTLVSLKKKAKQAVKDLGTTFYEEIRNRGKTERL